MAAPPIGLIRQPTTSGIIEDGRLRSEHAFARITEKNDSWFFRHVPPRGEYWRRQFGRQDRSLSGDISSEPGGHRGDRLTAELIRRWNPTAVLALGDVQDEAGTGELPAGLRPAKENHEQSEPLHPPAGAPEGHDPAAGDIGYWAPDGDLVFYYDSDAPFFNDIVRIGEFDGEMVAIERQSADFTVTIEQG